MADEPVDWNTNVPIMSPEGKMHQVPVAYMHEILAQPGNERAVPMADPNGTHHWVPESSVQDMVAQGNRISWPANQQIPKWFGFTPSNMLANAWSGAKGMIGGLYNLGADLVNNPNWFEGKNSTYQKFIGQPAAEQVIQAGQSLNAGLPAAAAGHALASAVPLVGPWAASLGEQAGRGDIGGAVGQAAGTVATGAALANAPRILNKVIPSTARAGAGLDKLTADNASYPVATPKAYRVAKAIENELDVTGENPHPVIKSYLTDEQLRNPSPTALDAGVQPMSPMSFWEARITLKRLNDIIQASSGFDAPGPARIELANLKRFSGALDEDITAAANRGGFGDEYQNLRNEYHRGSQMIRGAEDISPVIGGALGAYFGRGAGTLAATEAAGLGAVAGRMAGKPVVGSLVRSVVGRTGSPMPGSLPLPPIPRTPEEYTRTILAAKNGEISPGEASRRIAAGGGSNRVIPLPSPPQ
jgi:hypothetical protein